MGGIAVKKSSFNIYFSSIIIFGVLELFFYFLMQPKNLGLFFIIWAVIHFIFLLSNFSGNRRNGSYMGSGSLNGFGDICRYDIYDSAMNEITFKKKKSEYIGNKWPVTDPLNFINLLFIVVNGIGFVFYR